MSDRALDPPFPCPFCQSARVVLVGGGLVFLHYKCSDCAEVWTAMSQTRPAFLRPGSRVAGASTPDVETDPDLDAFDEGAWPTGDGGPSTLGPRKQKFWRH